MPRTGASEAPSGPIDAAAPVLAILVCHDGQRWLRPVLSALRNLAVRPAHLIAVDTGSEDATADLLGAADDVVDTVLTLPRDAGFGAAVTAALEHADKTWKDSEQPWLWLLHDDCAPEPSCLGALLAVSEISASAALLGPLTLDWDDPRLVVGAGLSTDASGQVQTGIGAVELDLGQFEQNTEVLAVSSAGALVRRSVWEELGGYDPALPFVRDDMDFGWRVNQADHVVLCVPGARMRHAGAMASGDRRPDEGRFRALDRAHGVRTYLVNTSTAAYVTGLPRLIVLCTVRGLGYLLVRRLGAARAEWGAAGYLMSGRAGLRAARRSRRLTRVRPARGVRGLLTNRVTRLRNGLRAGIAGLVRRRVQDDAAFGRLPDERAAWAAPVKPLGRSVEPDAGPSDPMTTATPPSRPHGGLRRPSRSVAVPVPTRPRPGRSLRRRPSPTRRSGSPAPTRGETTMQLPAVTGRRGELVMVEVGTGRLIRETLLAPPVLLFAATTLIALLVNRSRLGLDLAGGRLLPAEDLSTTWSSYLEAWLPVGGGSAAPSPATLSIIGVLGLPFGSPAAAASLLMLLAMPLAGLSAYFATRSIGVRREVRALVAGAYALLPAGTAAVSQGRLDVVVAHILLPPILAGTVAVLRGAADRRAGGWLSTACGTALCVAVVSAFAPVLHLLVLAVALFGFVIAPAPRAVTMRRGAALFMIVLLPLGMLLPWPAVVVQRPAVLVHGLGGVVPEDWPGWQDILTLDPGGAGASPMLGVLVIVAAAAAVVLRPSVSMVPAFAVALLGMGTAVLIGNLERAPMIGGDPRPGFTGGPLLFAGCGLLMLVLLACRPSPAKPEATAASEAAGKVEAVKASVGPSGAGPGAQTAPTVGGRTRFALYTAAGIALAAMASGAVLDGDEGPLDQDGPGLVALAAPSQDQLDRDKTWVLLVGEPTEPVRMTREREPRFGDDSVVPLRTTAVRLKRAADALRAGQPGETSAAIADVAASGVEFIVLPTRQQGDAALASSGGLAAAAPPTTDGRPVLRVLRPVAGAELLGPALAKEARSGSSPPTDPDTKGVIVDADPPELAAEVAPGADGRLLVLAANDEPGWEAKVNGEDVPTVRAWGHQVAVEVPGQAVEVTIDRSEVTRTVLLVVQAAIVLLALGTAIPSRVHRDD